MATYEDVKRVERIIGHTFSSGHLIRQALTSAGAEKDNYDGNRKLSQLGASLMDTLLAIIVYGTGAGRDCTANLRKEFTKKDHFSFAAKQTGIDQCIKYDQRTGSESPEVLRKAINAIIAAVFIDTWNIKFTLGVAMRIMTQEPDAAHFRVLFTTPAPTVKGPPPIVNVLLARGTGVVDPSMLLLDQQTIECHVPPMISTLLDQDFMAPFATSRAATVDNNLDLNGYSIQGSMPTYATTHLTDSSLDSSVRDYSHLSSTPNEGQGNQQSLRHTPAPNKKRKYAHRSPSCLASARIQGYLSEEKAKCMSQSFPSPTDTYFTPTIQEKALELENESLGNLSMILVTIACPHSIIALREIIRKERDHRNLQSCFLKEGISRQERYEIIHELDRRNAIIQLVRRYHILDLFQECGGSETRSTTGYVISTSTDFVSRSRNFGNPGHTDDANVSLAMLKEIFPDLRPNGEGYEKKLTAIKKLRKLGKRLNTLTMRFGRGVIGLMLDSSMALVSDTMILGPREDTFAAFVSLLEESQGRTLRQFSAAILPLLNSLLYYTLHDMVPFKLEKTDPHEISKEFKGSPSLLRLIC
ncbi:hypothetical protein BDV25DRAFT_166775 [Aspergillus avenaceus]|uniref:RNase III domain-containing protein n=1 Tax=Aspergillus avenaceus TaxID=36643 RepID=A0A5N6TE92_ASPAV|nr:hypothetical protein BDV25DRAFT_166775 [Aspergillus avenaceus]